MVKSAAALIVAPWDVVVFHSVMPRYSPILALVFDQRWVIVVQEDQGVLKLTIIAARL